MLQHFGVNALAIMEFVTRGRNVTFIDEVRFRIKLVAGSIATNEHQVAYVRFVPAGGIGTEETTHAWAAKILASATTLRTHKVQSRINQPDPSASD